MGPILSQVDEAFDGGPLQEVLVNAFNTKLTRKDLIVSHPGADFNCCPGDKYLSRVYQIVFVSIFCLFVLCLFVVILRALRAAKYFVVGVVPFSVLVVGTFPAHSSYTKLVIVTALHSSLNK